MEKEKHTESTSRQPDNGAAEKGKKTKTYKHVKLEHKRPQLTKGGEAGDGAQKKRKPTQKKRSSSAGKDPKDNAAVDALLPEIELRLASIAGEQHIYLKDEDVSTAIRTEAAGMAASAVGANPAVRAFLLDLQRSMAKKQDVLMDGRDIGTVVLPDATVKIFLTASPEARATRRWKEYQAKGIDTPYEEVLADVKQRDYQDTHRAAAPLKQAEDAVLLDTSDLNFKQSLAAMKKIIAEKVN